MLCFFSLYRKQKPLVKSDPEAGLENGYVFHLQSFDLFAVLESTFIKSILLREQLFLLCFYERASIFCLLG